MGSNKLLMKPSERKAGRKAPPQIRVFVDFDGTIALEDTTDVILERFAEPEWRVIEAEWLAGRIGSRECMARQVDLIRAVPHEIDDLIEDIPLDPHFLAFSASCRDNGIPLTVVSDGLDRVVTKMLARVGANVPVRANRLEWRGKNRWRLAFPFASEACRSAAGHCKCSALDKEPGASRILVGDGRSDFCAAETADLVIAKGALAEHCHSTGLSYLVFGNFAGAMTMLSEWLAALEELPELNRLADASHASPAA
jgi:2-hydroxy-3-keto-5-methylthiopentenyl-1-phosphate phosphatase